jgi:hypothetical protein
MSDRIVSLRGEPITADHKRDFMDYVAECYEDHVKAFGTQPVGIALGLTDIDGKCTTGVFTRNDEPTTFTEALVGARLSASAAER